jgi:hypothetical protein
MGTLFKVVLFLGFVVLLPWALLAAVYIGGTCK